MKRRLGWKRVYYTRQNVTRRRPSRETVSSEVIEAIRERNALDAQLYAHARHVLEERIREEGPSFASDVRRFHVLNGLYGKARRGYRAARAQAARVKAHLSST